MSSQPFFQVRDLRVEFDTPDGVASVLNGVHLEVEQGERLGLVGKSGSGKTVLAWAAVGLVKPPGRISGGEILLKGERLLDLEEEGWRRVRGSEIALIVSSSRSYFNPIATVGDQIGNILLEGPCRTSAEARERAVEILEAVGIPDPRRRLKAYPHELSGGMAQRVSIAMALACEPRLLLADEPTSGLDVTIQAQILDLIDGLIESRGLSTIMATRDLGVVAHYCDKVAVMFGGQIVEVAPVERFYAQPKHPYSQLMVAAASFQHVPQAELTVAQRSLNLLDLPRGCLYRQQCPEAMTICETEEPPAYLLPTGQRVKCHLYADEASPHFSPAIVARRRT